MPAFISKGGILTMKRIAIFCDGTWNRSDAEYATNVVKLSQGVAFEAPDGVTQQVFYIEGVGTGKGATGVARTLDRWGGGLFGMGLTGNIIEAFQRLVYAYAPGDEIYLFGFSRGAHTARSLAGLIRSSGIPSRADVGRIPEAMTRYRSDLKSTHPNSEASFAWRLGFSPRTTTSDEEVAWRQANGHPAGERLRITYIGVWDTVGALGVPGHYKLLASVFNGKHQFHDLALSRSVRAARHAVAIDERRRTFEPSLWSNLEGLAAETPQGANPYRQEWFAGNHGSVGGGGKITGLSDEAALWVAEGAEAMGLAFAPEWRAALEAGVDRTASLRNAGGAITLKDQVLEVTARDRAGPADVAHVSAQARARWKAVTGYRPKALARVKAALDAL